MRVFVYVDGLNLFFRSVKEKPELRWLDIDALVERILGYKSEEIKYYSARVSGKLDVDGPRKQQLYWNALESKPNISIVQGNFLIGRPYASLVHPPKFQPETVLPEPWPDVVRIHKAEEKGSDVNLASHLVRDAFTDRFDLAVVVTNDTDLVEPIKIVVEDTGKRVGLLSPSSKASASLVAAASFLKHIDQTDLNACQFPDEIEHNGKLIKRPVEWAAT